MHEILISDKVVPINYTSSNALHPLPFKVLHAFVNVQNFGVEER